MCHIIQGVFPKYKMGFTHGFTQEFTQELQKEIYISIYIRSYIIIFTTFKLLRMKMTSEGTLVKKGVTKPSVTSTKELQNDLMGSINKWHPPKHQGGPLYHELGSIIRT